MPQKIDITDINGIIANVKKGHIKDAIDAAKRCAVALGLWKQFDALSAQEGIYKAMAQYLSKDSDSNHRHKALGGIKEELLRLADALRLQMDIESPRPGRESDMYSTAIRTRRYLKQERLGDIISNTERSIEESKYDYIDKLFLQILTTQHLSMEEYKELESFLYTEKSDFAGQAMILSALGLANLYYYDRKKLQLLLEYHSFDNPALTARSLTGIFLTLWRHPARISLDVEMTDQIKNLLKNEAVFQNLHTVAMAFLASRDTERINAKMQNDIIPELQRLQSDFMRRFPGGTDMKELLDPEKNPEWEEMLQKSGLNDSMQELGEMQAQGGDVLMLPFSNLKNFSFFRSVGNWLLPFDTLHPSLSNVSEQDKELLDLIKQSADFLCDSDLYSLCLTIEKMPMGRGKKMLDQLGIQLEQYREDKATSLHKSLEAPIKSQITLYVRALSRLCNLFPNKGLRLPNPFTKAIVPTLLPEIGSLFNDKDMMQSMCEFLFTRGYYEEALPILLKMEITEPENPVLMEKTGFALQQTSDAEKALEYYHKAEILSLKPSKWLLRKLATLYRALGRHEEATRYWRLLSDVTPDDVKTTMQFANALFDNGEMEEALKYYYKVDYLNGGSPKTWRPIAWCEFRLGNHESSQTYYDRLLSLSEDATDCLNAGHLALARGRFDNAIELYRRAAIHSKGGVKWLLEQLAQDSDILLESGLDAEAQGILADRICYELEF